MSAKNQIKSMGKEQRLGFRQVAHTLWSGGWRAPTIAHQIGVNRSTVQRWTRDFAKRHADKAPQEKKRGPKKGSAAALKPAAAANIQRLITDKTPDQMKFPFALWCSEALRDLAARRFGVTLSRRSLRRYLRAWGFTPQAVAGEEPFAVAPVLPAGLFAGSKPGRIPEPRREAGPQQTSLCPGWFRTEGDCWLAPSQTRAPTPHREAFLQAS